MSPLSYNFKVLQWCGLWKTGMWSQGWRSWLYSFHTIVVCFFVFGFTSLGMLETFLKWENLDAAIDNLFMMLSMASVCGKMITILIYQGRIAELLKVLDRHVCRGRNAEEETIKENIHQLIRMRTKIFATMVQSTMALLIANFFVTFVPRRELPYKIWLPRNLKNSFEYGFVLFFEIVGNTLGAYINITYDSLVPSILLLACAQFSLLTSRLHTVGEKKFLTDYSQSLERHDSEKNREEVQTFSTCVKHQLLILEFIDTTNDIFGYTVCLQFSVSAVALCATVYKLAHTDLMSPSFLSLVVYISALLVQIFMLCIAATELTFHSYEFHYGLYDMQWYALTRSSKMNILFMMIRSTRPLRFTCMKFINVSLDSFFHLLKMSYSVYNVLKTSST